MNEAIVIGSGPHGVAATVALSEVHGRGSVMVVDDHDRALAAWSRRARQIGMERMRSPWVHHVSRHPDALSAFDPGDRHRPTARTPSVALFEAHARECLGQAAPRRRRARVVGLACRQARYGGEGEVRLGDGACLRARRVVVAIGLGAFRRPGLGGVPLPDAPVREHLGRVAILGGGHTAATAARRILAGGGGVDLFAPSGLRTRETDVEPGWFGPKLLCGYARSSLGERLNSLRGARYGSTPPELAAFLRSRVAPGLVRIIPHRATGIGWNRSGGLVSAGGATHGPYEEVYEATGYTIDVSRVSWLAPHVASVCGGWPVVDRHLQACSGLHVIGALAELELGPAGRNLWGAQRAAERLLECTGQS